MPGTVLSIDNTFCIESINSLEKNAVLKSKYKNLAENRNVLSEIIKNIMQNLIEFPFFM